MTKPACRAVPAFVAAIAIAAVAHSGEHRRPPNVILILMDDMG